MRWQATQGCHRGHASARAACQQRRQPQHSTAQRTQHLLGLLDAADEGAAHGQALCGAEGGESMPIVGDELFR